MQESTRRALVFAGVTCAAVALTAYNLYRAAAPEQPFRDRPFTGASRGSPERLPSGSESDSLVALATETRRTRADPAAREAIQAAFLAEGVDPEWARSKQTQVALIIGSMDAPTGSLLDIECRETLCRASFYYENPPDSGAIRAFSDEIERRSGLELLGDVGARREAAGTSMTIFLARRP